MKDIIIISDFSKTLSTADRGTTWSMLARSGLLGEEYIIRREKLYNKYHGFEINGDKQKTREWFEKHLELMVNSGLTLSNIKQLINNSEYIKKREGFEDLMEYLEKHSIPLIIITSGITNFVELFLDSLGIDRKNIQIFGNELVFNSEGKCIDYEKESVFCPLDNKSVFGNKLSINPSYKTLLMGDKKEDLRAYNSADITVGFGEKNEGYDYNLGTDGSLQRVINIIKTM